MQTWTQMSIMAITIKRKISIFQELPLLCLHCVSLAQTRTKYCPIKFAEKYFLAKNQKGRILKSQSHEWKVDRCMSVLFCCLYGVTLTSCACLWKCRVQGRVFSKEMHLHVSLLNTQRGGCIWTLAVMSHVSSPFLNNDFNIFSSDHVLLPLKTFCGRQNCVKTFMKYVSIILTPLSLLRPCFTGIFPTLTVAWFLSFLITQIFTDVPKLLKP